MFCLVKLMIATNTSIFILCLLAIFIFKCEGLKPKKIFDIHSRYRKSRRLLQNLLLIGFCSFVLQFGNHLQIVQAAFSQYLRFVQDIQCHEYNIKKVTFVLPLCLVQTSIFNGRVRVGNNTVYSSFNGVKIPRNSSKYNER